MKVKDAAEVDLLGVGLAEPPRDLSKNGSILPVGVIKTWSVDQMNPNSRSVGETVDLNIACTWLRMRR